MASISRPKDKDNLDLFKTDREIDKIEEEISQLKKSKWRFRIGTILVPLAVALATLYTVGKTGFFNAWQTKNENAEHDFKRDTSNFNKQIESYSRTRDKIQKDNAILEQSTDSLNGVILELRNTLNTLNQKTLTETDKVNFLLRQNRDIAASGKHSYDSLMDVQEKLKQDNQKLDDRRFSVEQSDHELRDDFQNCQNENTALRHKLEAYTKKNGPNP